MTLRRFLTALGMTLIVAGLTTNASAAVQMQTQTAQPLGMYGYALQTPGIVNGDPVACAWKEAYYACKRGCRDGGNSRSAFGTCRMLCEKMFCG